MPRKSKTPGGSAAAAEAARLAAASAPLADELGALERELAPFAMKISRIEALRRQIRQVYALQPPEKSFTITAQKFIVELGSVAGGGATVSYVTKGSRSLKVMERPNAA